MADVAIRAVLEAQDNMSAAMRAAQGAVVNVAQAVDGAQASLDNARDSMKNAGGASEGLRDRLGSLSGVAGKLGLAIGAAGAAKAVYEFIGAGKEFNSAIETARVQFQSYGMDADEARKHVERLTNFAASTPFQMPSIIDASRHLKTFGADAIFGEESLRMIGDAAAGVSAPIDEVAMWVGRLYTNLESGKPVGEAAARLQELGLLGGPARTALEDAAAGAGGLDAAVSVLGESFGRFDGAMEELSTTTAGLESTLGDLTAQAAGAFVDAIGVSGEYKRALELVNAALTGFINLLRGSPIERNVEEVGDLKVQMELLEGNIATAKQRNDETWPRMTAQLQTVKDRLVQVAVETENLARAEIKANIAREMAIINTSKNARELQNAERRLEKYRETMEMLNTGPVPTFIAQTDDAADALGGAGGAAGVSVAAAGAAAVEELAPLTSGVTALNDRLATLNNTTRDTINNLIGSQGLTNGFQQAAAGARLASFDIAGLSSNMLAVGPSLNQSAIDLGDWGETAGTGLMGKFKSAVATGFGDVMGIVHGFAQGGWKGGVMQLANTALSFLPPGMAQAAQAALGAFSAVWNKWFKKPSEAEIQARAAFEGVREGFVENLGDVAEYNEYVNSLISQGWDRNLAEVKAGFDYWGRQAGATWDEIGVLYGQYQDAVKAGDAEEMARIDGIIQGWREKGQAAQDAAAQAAEAEAEAARAAAEAHQQFMDGVFSNVIGAWDRAKQAGVSAYDETYAAAIEAGAGEEEAVAKATAARIDAKNRILQEEGDKYARLAAFEAALEAIRNGNAAGAAEAARQAAQQTRDAWDTALGAVAVADGIANDTVADGAKTTADDVIEEAERTQRETVLVAQEAADQQAIAAEDAANRQVEAARGAVVSINEAFEGLKDQTVTVNYVAGDTPTYTGEGEIEGRAFGGPVSAGVPYVVGELGPEVIVPRQSGTVVPTAAAGGVVINANFTLDGSLNARKTAERVVRALSDLQVSR